MGVVAEIGQHLLRTAEGRLGIDDPFDPAELARPSGEGGGLSEAGGIAEESEFTGIEGDLQFVPEPSAKQTREHADREEEIRLACNPSRAIQRGAAARHNAMEMGIRSERLLDDLARGRPSS